jgi:8-oxo-dGTP pyrophosphatase MutT (NUDIX family)
MQNRDMSDLSANPELPALWPPDVTVATVVQDRGRFLMVEERVRDRIVWNQPAGHLDPGETLADAAVRETLEETAWNVRVTGLIAVYQWLNPGGRQILRFTFSADALNHERHRALDTGILRAEWLTLEQLRGLNGSLRSPMVVRSIEDYLSGQCAPLYHVHALTDRDPLLDWDHQ